MLPGIDLSGASNIVNDLKENHPFGEFDIGTNTIIDGYNNFIEKTEGSALDESEPSPSLSDYMKDNPDLSYEDYLKWMSQHSDEWAEKYLDYLTERGELDRANQYTAEREDTAYQRLVNDLKSAGLNPAMMYGSSASPSAGGSQGYVKMSEGANSRSVANYSKLKNLMLQYMLYELKRNLGTANTIIEGVGSFAKILGAFF